MVFSSQFHVSWSSTNEPVSHSHEWQLIRPVMYPFQSNYICRCMNLHLFLCWHQFWHFVLKPNKVLTDFVWQRRRKALAFAAILTDFHIVSRFHVFFDRTPWTDGIIEANGSVFPDGYISSDGTIFVDSYKTFDVRFSIDCCIRVQHYTIANLCVLTNFTVIVDLRMTSNVWVSFDQHIWSDFCVVVNFAFFLNNHIFAETYMFAHTNALVNLASMNRRQWETLQIIGWKQCWVSKCRSISEVFSLTTAMPIKHRIETLLRKSIGMWSAQLDLQDSKNRIYLLDL